MLFLFILFVEVSIHAPLRGATKPGIYAPCPPPIVSIHAPLRGATAVSPCSTPDIPVSIHAPLRGATTPEKLQKTYEAVSIHAPLRGATISTTVTDSATLGFNPRTPAGCDLRVLSNRLQEQVFQSTHPCGVRLNLGAAGFRKFRVSIHAPLRGATFDSVCAYQARVVSIHAPLRGATSA